MNECSKKGTRKNLSFIDLNIHDAGMKHSTSPTLASHKQSLLVCDYLCCLPALGSDLNTIRLWTGVPCANGREDL